MLMSVPTLTRAQVRDVDRRAIEDYGLPGVVLMENAGRGVVELLCRLGCSGPIVICAGKGNNGGDGFVIARHLAIRGIRTTVVLCCDREVLQGDAAIHYRVLQRAGLAGKVLGHDIALDELRLLLKSADWIVDALLGTGAQGPVRDSFVSVIAAMNDSGRRVLAVDLPSGMDCDTGVVANVCVRASATATFVARKPGFDAAGAASLTGTVHIIDIGIPPQLLDELVNSKT